MGWQGYWTYPTWPTSNRTPAQNDTDTCPKGGCLFNIISDPEERKELSQREPAVYAAMHARMAQLAKEKFQSDYAGAYTDCISVADSVTRNRGFYAPICSKPN